MAYNMKGSPMLRNFGIGASPAKQLKPRDKSMEPVGPRGEKGYFKTVEPDGTNTPSTTETKPDTNKGGKKGPVITGDTKVKTTRHTKYTKDGKKYSKIRGIAPDATIEKSTVGPKGKQKGKTKVDESEGAGGARKYKRDDSNPFTGNRTYDPKTREISEY